MTDSVLGPLSLVVELLPYVNGMEFCLQSEGLGGKP